MKDHFADKSFTYEHFVEELRGLVEIPKQFDTTEHGVNNPVFKGWKRRVEDAMRKVQDVGYARPQCQIGQRHFGSLWSDEGENFEAFWNDLNDTIDEMRLIVENFQKYGKPEPTRRGATSFFGTSPVPVLEANAPSSAPVPPPAVPHPLLPPEKVTIKWMITHVDLVKGWGAILVVLGSAFTAGIGFDAYVLHPERTMAQSLTPSPVPAASPSPKPQVPKPESKT